MQWKTINDLAQNVLWMCDCCMDHFIHTKNGNSSDTTSTKQSIDDDVKELKIVVAGVLNTIASITKSLPRAEKSPTNSEVVHTTVHTTPSGSFSLLNGTACDDTAIDDESDGIRNTSENDNFSVLLTNIDSSVSECDIQRMVSRAMGIPNPERIDVTKLVSKRKAHLNLDFISFKIVLPTVMKSRAFNPTTWPRNVRFREFIRKTNTWRPNV